MWGKRNLPVIRPDFHRSTPTRVGKTFPTPTTRSTRKVHPHACGENIPFYAKNRRAPGPPPRVWGKPKPTDWMDGEIRSTPTRVGKTEAVVTIYTAVMVHPHACGENCHQIMTQPRYIGPPPRVWGKQDITDTEVRSYRSTPTRVGKTVSGSASESPTMLHPHACGENVGYAYRHRRRLAPPPRVWGKRRKPAALMDNPSSTPTRVGKTGRAMTEQESRELHPHACGENYRFRRPLTAFRAPPPRVWGKLWQSAW